MTARMWRGFAIAALAAAVLAAATWYAGVGRHVAASPSVVADGKTTTRKPGAPATGRPLRPGPPALDLPSADAPTRVAVAALLPMAESGRADAMHALAMDLMHCALVSKGSDAELRSAVLKRFYSNLGHEPTDEDDVARVASDVDALVQQRDDCDGISADLLSQRVAWLEKAARAGDPQAQLDFATHGLSGMGRDDILMQPDEVERRRELAGDQLQRSLANGNCDALYLLAQAYSGQKNRVDWIYPQDLAQAGAYAAAAKLDGQARYFVPDLDLDAAQQAVAERQGQALYARYCHGQPDG